jgi:hypothetical protein
MLEQGRGLERTPARAGLRESGAADAGRHRRAHERKVAAQSLPAAKAEAQRKTA